MTAFRGATQMPLPGPCVLLVPVTESACAELSTVLQLAPFRGGWAPGHGEQSVDLRLSEVEDRLQLTSNGDPVHQAADGAERQLVRHEVLDHGAAILGPEAV